MKFKFIEKMGGYTAVYLLLKEAKYSIKEEQVIRVWESRKSIPASAQLKLMEIAGKRGIALGYDDFEYDKKLTTTKKKD